MHRRTLVAGSAIAAFLGGTNMTQPAQAAEPLDPENTIYMDIKQ